MLASETDPASLAGLELVDRRGERLGRIRQIYPDGGTIGWAGVRGNLIGTTEALIPLDGADLEDGVITVPIARARFLSAPRRTPDAPMDEAEREQLRRFYSDRPAPARPLASGTPSAVALAEAPDLTVVETSPEPVAEPAETAPEPAAETAPAEETAPQAAPEPVAAVQAAPQPEPAAPQPAVDELTRSEQRIRVDTTPVPNTRVVLRRVVVTEQKTITVPVRREELRLVREPIVGAEPVSGIDLVESEQEIVLHEERVVVRTEVVPIERIRLVREALTETREVTGQVWREHIEASQE